MRLRAEVIETTGSLADLLERERAVLIWGRSPPVGFLISVAVALRHLPQHIGPKPGEIGPGGVGFNVLLVSDDGTSRLSLEYEHFGTAAVAE